MFHAFFSISQFATHECIILYDLIVACVCFWLHLMERAVKIFPLSKYVVCVAFPLFSGVLSHDNRFTIQRSADSYPSHWIYLFHKNCKVLTICQEHSISLPTSKEQDPSGSAVLRPGWDSLALIGILTFSCLEGSSGSHMLFMFSLFCDRRWHAY